MGKQVSSLISKRISLAKPASDGFHLRACALDGDAVGHAAKDKPRSAIIASEHFGSGDQGHPQVLLLWKGKASRHDADYGAWNAIHAHRAADNA